DFSRFLSAMEMDHYTTHHRCDPRAEWCTETSPQATVQDKVAARALASTGHCHIEMPVRGTKNSLASTPASSLRALPRSAVGGLSWESKRHCCSRDDTR